MQHHPIYRKKESSKVYILFINLCLPCKFRISRKDKERIIEALENGEDALRLSSIFKIPYSSIRTIVFNFKKNGVISKGSRGGRRPKSLNEENGNKILDYIENYPEATLLEMSKFIEPWIKCSCSTIARFLKGKLITIKKIRGSVLEKNSDRVKELRFKYMDRMFREKWKHRQCVYIDEIGFNMWLRRPENRSLKGTPINRTLPSVRGKNISCVMAITKNGIAHFQVLEGSFKRETYQSFLIELSTKLPDTKHYFIQDNASIHSNCITWKPEHEMVYLPPYSPFLNPIECVFSKLKRRIRSKMGLTGATNMTRLSYIKGLLEEEVNSNQFNDLREYYNHIQTFTVKVILKEDIFGD